MQLKLKIVPKASRNVIAGWLGEELKIKVTAAPEKGKANQAVVALLANALGLPKQAIIITAGQTSVRKTVEIDGIADTTALRQRLASIEMSRRS